MDLWAQRVEGSQAIKDARELRGQLLELMGSHDNPEDIDYLKRLDNVAAFCVARLESADPQLVTEKVLSDLASNLANIRTYLTDWTNGSRDHLTVHAQNSAEAAIRIVTRIPQMDVPGASQAVAVLRKSVNGYRLAIDNQAKSINDQTQSTREEFAQEVKKVADDLTNVSQNLTDLKTSVQNIETSSQEFITRQQTAFSTAETARSESFSTLLEENRKDLGEALQKLKTDSDTSVKNTLHEVETKKDEAFKAADEIDKLLGIVGEKSLVANYSTNAKHDQLMADIWRYATAGSIAIGIIFAGWFAFSVDNAQTSWKELVAKLVVTLSFAALATYAGRQSAEHRKAQRGAEQMATQLAAVRPYLSTVADQALRDKLLTEIAERLFVGQEQQEGKDMALKDLKEDPTTIGLLARVIEEVLKAKRQS